MDWDDPVDSFLHEQWLRLVQDAEEAGAVQLITYVVRHGQICKASISVGLLCPHQ